MTMVVDFADGFTSNTSPNLIGLGNETYPILNNQSVPVVIDGLIFGGYSSVSGFVEIERSNGSDSFRQIIDFKIRKDDVSETYGIEFGSYSGDDLQQSSVTLPGQVNLTIDDDGQMFYTSGNMDSFEYDGKLKFNLNRINT